METIRITKSTTRINRITQYLNKVIEQTGHHPLNKKDPRYSAKREEAFWDAVERYFPKERDHIEVEEHTPSQQTDDRVRTGLHVKFSAGDTSTVSTAELRRNNNRQNYSNRTWKLRDSNTFLCPACSYTSDLCIC